MASLMVHVFAESAIAMGLSWAILFLDLRKAFDLALRQSALGWMQCSTMVSLAEKMRHLVSLGVPEALAQDLVEWIDSTGGLLSQCPEAAANAKALINSLHDKAWFRLDKDSEYIHTAAGGRQGCFLGPVVFNMVYSIALRRTRRRLAQRGLLISIKVRDRRPFWASAGATWEWVAGQDSGDEKVFEVAFVDDVAALLSAPSAALLVELLPSFIEELCLGLVSLGFRVNWSEGKTEAFVSLRGKGSHERRQRIAEAGNVLPINPACGASSVRLVSTYKHFGSMLDSEAGVAPDVSVRSQRAMSSYAPI